MTLDALLGGLIGSLFTIVVTKLLDMLQKANEHKYSLRKAFFEKKLAAAESAVAKWYSYASSLSALSALYDQFSKPDKRAGGKVFDTLNQLYSSQLTKIETSASEIANSIYLYFDIDSDTLRNKEPMKSFFDTLIEIQDLALSADVLKELKGQLKGTEDEPFVDSETERVREQIRSKLKGLSATFDASQKQINGLLKGLREQMNKYDL